MVTNIGPFRAWRAPNHPQQCLITMSALEDLAAKLAPPTVAKTSLLPDRNPLTTGGV